MIPQFIKRKFIKKLFTIECDVMRNGEMVTLYASGGMYSSFDKTDGKAWVSIGAIKNHLHCVTNISDYKNNGVNVVAYTIDGDVITRSIERSMDSLIEQMSL